MTTPRTSAATNTILMPLEAESVARASRVYFLPLRLWAFIFVVATLVATLTANAYAFDSPWVGVGLWLAVVVALHTAMAARAVPWIPGLIALIAILQWVLAPWAGYHVPAPISTLTMAVPADQYFRYAVPATLLFTVGLYLPLWRIGRRVSTARAPMLPPDFVRSCDLMVGVGLAATVAQGIGVPFSLRYAVALIEYLAFVGAFALALARADGWGWRLGGLLALRAALSTTDGTFHELLLWLGYSFVLLAFLLQWRPRTLGLITLSGLLSLGALNELKLSYRLELSENPDLGMVDRVTALGTSLGHQLQNPLEPFTGRSLSRTVARVNQGWIISRVMYWTPTREPYANGETLVTAVRATLVPRVIDPNKYMAGGYSFFTRFTGMSLRGTSMNLSPAGEMYANFGPAGGLAGVFGFALCLGLLYGLFARWSTDSTLWWAWAPYVMLYTMQAETGIGEALNHVVRSFLILWVVVALMPAWKNLRRWRMMTRRLRYLGIQFSLPSLTAGARQR